METLLDTLGRVMAVMSTIQIKLTLDNEVEGIGILWIRDEGEISLLSQ